MCRNWKRKREADSSPGFLSCIFLFFTWSVCQFCNYHRYHSFPLKLPKLMQIFEEQVYKGEYPVERQSSTSAMKSTMRIKPGSAKMSLEFPSPSSKRHAFHFTVTFIPFRFLLIWLFSSYQGLVKLKHTTIALSPEPAVELEEAAKDLLLGLCILK